MDAVVEVALEHLSSRVNLNTGLVHPMDKKAAVETFRILWKAWYSLMPSEIESWALSHDWTVEGARDLQKVAVGVREGRRFRLLGGPSLRPDVLEIWRKEAGGRS
jgi:hypothetical protein